MSLDDRLPDLEEYPGNDPPRYVMTRPGLASGADRVFHLTRPGEPREPFCSRRSPDLGWQRYPVTEIPETLERCCRRCDPTVEARQRGERGTPLHLLLEDESVTDPEQIDPVSREVRTDGGDPQETRVGHCRQDDVDVYIGRGNSGVALGEVPPRSRGGLGNPYPLDKYTREESLERFRADFEAALETGPNLRAYVAELRGEILGCWCRRLDEDAPACHGDLIAEWADRLGRPSRTSDQDTLVPDGGRDTDRPAFFPPDVDWVECYLCGRIINDPSRADGLDISSDDAYYPEIVPVCRDGQHRKTVADGGRLYDCPECGTVDDVVETESRNGDFTVTRCAECRSRVYLTDGGHAAAERERLRGLVERSDLKYFAEILDHIDEIEDDGLKLVERDEWRPDPGTPAELVAWDLGLLYGYYLCGEDHGLVTDGGIEAHPTLGAINEDDTVRLELADGDVLRARVDDVLHTRDGDVSAHGVTLVEDGPSGRVIDVVAEHNPRSGWGDVEAQERVYRDTPTRFVDLEIARIQLLDSVGVDPDRLDPGRVFESLSGDEYRVVVPAWEREYDDKVLAYNLDDGANVLEKVAPGEVIRLVR